MRLADTLPARRTGTLQTELWERQTRCGGWGGVGRRESQSGGRKWSVASVATGNGKCSQHGGGPKQRAGQLTRQEGP